MIYGEKKKRGICHLCGAKASESRAYCDVCADKRAAKARADRRTNQKQCKHCGKEFTRFRRREYCHECSLPTSTCRKSYLRNWRQVLKREVFEAYGGSVCACCGEGEFIFLSIDHIENNGAAHRRIVNPKHSKNTSGVRFYGWLKRNKFPVGYQVLCMNCQWGKKHNGGICPHKAN